MNIDTLERVETQYGGVEWHTPGLLIKAWVEGDWTDESAAFFNREFLQKIEESPAEKVSIIFGTENMRMVLVSPHSSVKQLNYLTHKKVGKVILYGVPMPQRAIVGLLINVLNGAFKGKVGLAKDEHDALTEVTTNTPPSLRYA